MAGSGASSGSVHRKRGASMTREEAIATATRAAKDTRQPTRIPSFKGRSSISAGNSGQSHSENSGRSSPVSFFDAEDKVMVPGGIPDDTVTTTSESIRNEEEILGSQIDALRSRMTETMSKQYELYRKKSSRLAETESKMTTEIQDMRTELQKLREEKEREAHEARSRQNSAEEELSVLLNQLASKSAECDGCYDKIRMADSVSERLSEQLAAIMEELAAVTSERNYLHQQLQQGAIGTDVVLTEAGSPSVNAAPESSFNIGSAGSPIASRSFAGDRSPTRSPEGSTYSRLSPTTSVNSTTFLQTQLAATLKEMARLNEQVCELEKREKNLQMDLDTALDESSRYAEECGEMRVRIKTLEAEKKELAVTSARSIEALHAEHSAEIEDHKNQVAALMSDREGDDVSIAGSSGMRSPTGSASSVETRLQQSEALRRRAEGQTHSLQQQISKLSEALSGVNKENARILREKSDLEARVEELQELEGTAVHAESSQAELVKYEAMMEAASVRQDSLAKQLQDAETRETEMNQQLSEYMEIEQSLLAEIESLRRDNESEEVSKLHRQIESLQEHISIQASENRRLNDQISRGNAASTAGSASDEASATAVNLPSFDGKTFRAAMPSPRRDVSNKRSVAELEALASSLREEKAEVQRQLEFEVGQRKELESLLDTSADDNRVLAEDKARATQALEDATSELRRLREELDNAREHLRRLTEESKSQRLALLHADNEKALLMEQYEELKGEKNAITRNSYAQTSDGNVFQSDNNLNTLLDAQMQQSAMLSGKVHKTLSRINGAKITTPARIAGPAPAADGSPSSPDFSVSDKLLGAIHNMTPKHLASTTSHMSPTTPITITSPMSGATANTTSTAKVNGIAEKKKGSSESKSFEDVFDEDKENGVATVEISREPSSLLDKQMEALRAALPTKDVSKIVAKIEATGARVPPGIHGAASAFTAEAIPMYRKAEGYILREVGKLHRGSSIMSITTLDRLPQTKVTQLSRSMQELVTSYGYLDRTFRQGVENNGQLGAMMESLMVLANYLGKNSAGRNQSTLDAFILSATRAATTIQEQAAANAQKRRSVGSNSTNILTPRSGNTTPRSSSLVEKPSPRTRSVMDAGRSRSPATRTAGVVAPQTKSRIPVRNRSGSLTRV